MRDYKRIKAYQMADDLVMEGYNASKSFPKEELYCLTSQFRRAIVSVPANIVEGASRKHKKDYLQFLYISRGSLAEVEYLTSLAKRLGYLDNETFQRIESLVSATSKTLYGLISSVESETL